MAGFILGTKSGVSQKFTDSGARLPYTKIITSPCFLVGVRTHDRDGYMAAIMGTSTTKNLKKTTNGKLTKAGIETPLRFFKEVRLNRFSKSNPVEVVQKDGKDALKIGDVEIAIGQELKPEVMFVLDEQVTVTARSKGKGFQGVVKRFKFAGGPATHGQSDRERAPGSIGQSATPGRVYKGKRMPGRMGSQMTTIKNAKIIEINEDSISVSGFVPGAEGSLVLIKTV